MVVWVGVSEVVRICVVGQGVSVGIWGWGSSQCEGGFTVPLRSSGLKPHIG